MVDLASFPGSPPPSLRVLFNAYVNCARGGGEPGNEAMVDYSRRQCLPSSVV